MKYIDLCDKALKLGYGVYFETDKGFTDAWTKIVEGPTEYCRTYYIQFDANDHKHYSIRDQIYPDHTERNYKIGDPWKGVKY